MLQKSQQSREGPHPSLPLSLPAPTIRKTLQEHQSLLRQTVQKLPPPRLWELWTQITPPPLKPHTNPLPPETCTFSPLPNTPQPYHIEKKKSRSGPVQTTCSNTLSSMSTRHFSHTLLGVHYPTKDSVTYVFACSCMFPCCCLTYYVSLCTCTGFMWNIFIVCIQFLYTLQYLLYIYSLNLSVG